MKRVWTALLAALAVLCMLAGCAPADGEQQTPEPDAEVQSGALQLSADYIVLGVGRSKQLSLTLNGESVPAAEAQWSASDASVSVEAGLVTGVAQGECTVTALCRGERAQATVVVSAVMRLVVPERDIVLTAGGTARLDASLQELSGEELTAGTAPITYTSLDTNVVTAAADGTLTGVAQGTAQVLVESAGMGCAVTVSVYGNFVSLETAEDFMEKIAADPDGTFRLSADLDFTDIQYFAIPEFSGVLLGEGHKLSNLLLVNHNPGEASDNYGGALFMNMRGTVRDLYIGAKYESVTRETDQQVQRGIQQCGGTVANFLYGTVQNVYLEVKFDLYPWWGPNYNEAGAVCGRLRGDARISNCIVSYVCTQPSGTLSHTQADIHAIYGMTDGETKSPVLENIYLLNGGEYRKDYRPSEGNAATFGSVLPVMRNIGEYESESSLASAVQGTAAQRVYSFAQA